MLPVLCKTLVLPVTLLITYIPENVPLVLPDVKLVPPTLIALLVCHYIP